MGYRGGIGDLRGRAVEGRNKREKKGEKRKREAERERRC